jgi:hypothetical protein
LSSGDYCQHHHCAGSNNDAAKRATSFLYLFVVVTTGMRQVNSKQNADGGGRRCCLRPVVVACAGDIDGTHWFVLPWRRSTMMMMGGRSLLLLLLVHFGIVIEHSFSSSSSTAAASVLVVGRRRRRNVHGRDDHGRDGQFLARALVILILEVMVKQPLGAEAGPGRHPTTKSMVAASSSTFTIDPLICTVWNGPGPRSVFGKIYVELAILLSFIPYVYADRRLPKILR